MKKYFSLTLKEIPKIAKDIAHQLHGGEILALIGDLGSGKTAFTKALARHLKIKGRITSPTFMLMNIFPARLPKTRKGILFLHLDLYRTKNFSEIKALGLTELWGKKNTITAIEWADKIKNHLPKKTWIIKFDDKKN